MEVIPFPKTLHIGDSISVTAILSSYPASSGWSVKLVVTDGTNRYQINSVADGDNHTLAANSATTGAWVAGSYKWVALAIDPDERFKVSSGDIEVKPDILTTAIDYRTHAEKVLTALEAVIEGKATSDDYATSIRGKSLTRYSPEELTRWRNIYRSEVREERIARQRRQGKQGINLIRVRF